MTQTLYKNKSLGNRKDNRGDFYQGTILFLDNITKKFVQSNNNNNVFSDYGPCVSEMNDNNVIMDRRDKLGIILCYKVLVVPVKQCYLKEDFD